MTTVPYHRKHSAVSILHALNHGSGRPLVAMIEVADRCNEVCVHCYQIQGQKGELSTQDWRKVLDDLARFGILLLVISGGEATLRRDFLELVAYARKLKFSVKLYTNGLTMTRPLAQSLAELAVQEVQISLYSHRPETHDWVTRVPGSFDKTVAGIRHLVEAGVAVMVKSPLMSFNAEDFSAYIEFVTGLGADYGLDATLTSREDGDAESTRFRMSEEDYRRALEDPRLGRTPRRDHPPPLDRRVCGACHGTLHIEADGEMRPCAQLGVPVGHALRDGVAPAYEHHPQGKAIRSLTWGDLHGCRDCDLRAYCGRCFAQARSERGDALGPYASACRRARVHYEVAHRCRLDLLAAERDAEAPGPEVGPYRLEAGHRLVPIEDRVDAGDLERRRMAWVAGEAHGEPERARPGQLVQLRRPGAKRARVEKIPLAAERTSEAAAGFDIEASQSKEGRGSIVNI